MKSLTKKRYENIFLTIFIFLFLFVVFLFNIYSTDDFTTRDNYGSVFNCFKSSLHMGNGRILGNFILYVFGFMPLFRIVFKPLVITAIIFLCEYVFNIKEMWQKITVSLLIIIPSSGFFANCYINNPCFANYVTPLFCFLVCMALIKISYWKNTIQKIAFNIVVFIFAVCMQLFSENTSIVSFAFAGFMLIYSIVRKKDKLKYSVFFSGTVVGLLIMLFVPKMIGYVSTDMSAYRGLVFDIPFAVGVIAKFSDYFSTVTLWIFIFGAMQIFLLKKEATKDRFYTAHFVIATIYPSICILYKFTRTPLEKVISGLALLLTALMALFLINAAVIFIKYLKQEEAKVFSLGMLILMGISVGMFMFININGYRVFYLTVFIFICLNLFFLNYLNNNYSEIQTVLKPSKEKKFACLVLMCCFAVMLPLQIIQEYDAQVMRHEYVEERLSAGDKEIYIPKIPNKNMVRDIYIDFYSSYVMKNYPDVEFYFVDIEDWDELDQYYALQNNPWESITYAVRHLDYGNKKSFIT